MNKKFQNILDIIQQSDKLDAEQKNNLLKAVKDADKELEITAFKLERTEKVKKTTAILLEETIEELEQKRKAVEQQNRELEIEASLERVRAVAMGMHKSDDLLSVCEILYKELHSLGFDEIRNAIINIFNDTEEKFLNYDYSDYGVGGISEVDYNSHPSNKKFVNKMREANKDFMITEFTGNELDEWRKWRIDQGQMPDSKLDQAESLYYYEFSIGVGSIGISTFSPINADQLKILSKIRNVFSLAYQRYSDIALAEAQTREAEIELALERVRARTMAMQKSEDLKEVIQLVYEQFDHLKINVDHAGFVVDYTPKGDWHFWIADQQEIPSKITHPYFESVWATQFSEAKEKGMDFFATNLNFEEKNKFYQELFKFIPDVPGESLDFYFNCPGLAGSTVLLDNVGLYIENFSGTPYSEEDNKILMRFGKVFQQTYTRFLDLQKAEAQTRESQIQLGLERVRASSMAMHNSADVGNATAIMFTELEKLGIETIRCGIDIMDKSKVMEVWATTSSDTGKVFQIVGKLDSRIHPHLQRTQEAWERQEKFTSSVLEGQDLKDYYKKLSTAPDYRVPVTKVQTNKQFNYDFFFKEGGLFAYRLKPFTEEQIMILQRFTAVFGLTFRRYLDLKKAEEQTRESQIELALERVRAKTMAMHNSQDVGDTVVTLFDEVLKLGLDQSIRCGIGILEGNECMETWSATSYPNGEVDLKMGMLDMTIHPMLIGLKKAWKNGEQGYSYDYVGDDVFRYYDALNKEPDYPFQIDLDSLPENEYHKSFFFTEGILFAFAPNPISEEASMVLDRFARVFGQTYRRYLDLQKAEEQAREAQIEASLEKVRAVAMSMNKSEDLLNICKVSFDEFKKLGFGNIRNALIHIQYDEQKYFMDYDFSDLTGGAITKIEYGSHPVVEDYLQQINSAEDAFYQGVIKEDQLEEWKNFRKNSGQIDDPRLEKATALYYYFFSIGIGDIGISTLQPIEDTQIKILKRFRNVFDLAYRRYNDIALAEEQARETQIQLALERVRAKAMAMHTSNDLSDTMGVLFKELPKLGINSLRCGVDLLSKSTTRGVFYAAATTQESDTFALIGAGDMTNHPEFMKQYKSWLKNENYFMTLRDEELRSYYESISTWLSIPYNPREHKTQTEHGYYFSFSEGMFYAWTERPYSDDEINILNRFKAIIDLTFRRYLDLKKAEAQAREAQIEAALEKVRAVAMGMIKSDDLMNVSKALLKGLNALGFENIRNTQIDILNDDKGSFLNYEYSDYGVSGVTEVFYNSHPHVQQFVKDVHSSSDALSLIIISGSDLDEWRDYRKQANHLPDPKLDEATSLYYYCYSIGMGALGVSSFSQISDEKLEILKRFRNVFGLAYRRYNDIAVAEAQAREAEIEAALERVRSRTMAMQKSDELAETASHLFVQLNSLGIKPYRFNIAIVNPESENCQLWSTTNEGKVIPSGPHIPLKEYTVFNQMYDGWKLQQNVQVIKLLGEERITWTKYIMKYVSFNEYKPENIDLERLRDEPAIFSNFFFKQGFIVVHTIKEIDESDIKIIQRFVNVFEQTYTRFLDLQKAEEQAREAIKQASLDRVRGEIASMRTSEDLNRITPIIWNELKTLEVPFFRCGVFIVDEANENVQVYLTTPEGKSLGVLHLPFNSNELTKNTVEYWRQKQVYKDHWDKKKFLIWMQSMIELGQVKNTETYQGSAVAPESLNLHFVPFAQGMLYVGDIQPLTDEKLELVKILAKAFSIAYARYEDFKNLEAAKNKIEITLDELRSAQTQLIHAEKMASLGELTAGIAHEIKNPLNFVNNFSEVSRELLDEMQIEIKNNNIEEVIDLVEDLKQNLEKINQHGKRADSIVKGMLLHSRGTTGEKTLTDINDLLDQYVNLAYHGMRAQNKEFNITIEKDYDETLDKINIVPQDISRVFLNIINNACYAAYDRKKKGANNFSPTLKVSTKKLNDKVEILIGDNGNGIPADYLDKIFQPFFTTKPSGEGTGLGLSLSYDIVTKVHGGELKVETKEAEGTTFIIQLPSH